MWTKVYKLYLCKIKQSISNRIKILFFKIVLIIIDFGQVEEVKQKMGSYLAGKYNGQTKPQEIHS